MSNIIKVNNKDNRMTSGASNVNFEYFALYYCYC